MQPNANLEPEAKRVMSQVAMMRRSAATLIKNGGLASLLKREPSPATPCPHCGLRPTDDPKSA